MVNGYTIRSIRSHVPAGVQPVKMHIAGVVQEQRFRCRATVEWCRSGPSPVSLHHSARSQAVKRMWEQGGMSDFEQIELLKGLQ